MSLRYNAFISYRHAPLDTKVASEVQRQLERFRIPGAIQRSTGMKRIDRIFRDKEELTITSDLNETIENALNHSDYLIVICSESTRESVWVQREIEFFLKTHDRKHILTVVAEGEPCDVVPQILQYQQMELMTEEGNVETVQVPIEPLSCDYRMNFSKARRDELPRLAAALLGCTYDDLRQRQRQYRTRRITAAVTAAGAALACLAVYYAWSAARIRQNYQQALRNQSEYLASESQKLLDRGDRLTAMLLAMEALPSEEDDRPVVASAVNALAEAVYAYVPEGIGECTLSSAFNHEGTVNEFFCSEDGSRLYVRHSLHNVTVWDLQSHTQLLSRRFDDSVYSMSLTAQGDLIVVKAYSVICLENGTWEELWRYESNYSLFNTEVKALPGLEAVVMNVRSQFVMLNSRSGKVLMESESLGGQEQWTHHLHGMSLSPSGRYAASAVDLDDGYTIAVWDLVDDTLTLGKDVVYDYYSAVCVLDDGSAVLMGNAEDDMETSYTYTAKGVDYRYLYDGLVKIFRMAPDGGTVWSSLMEYSQQYYGYEIILTTYPAQPDSRNILTDENGNPCVAAVLCTGGSAAELFDITTGQSLDRAEFPASIVQTVHTPGSMMTVLSSGYLALYSYSMQVPTTLNDMMEDLEQSIKVKGGFLVSQLGSQQVLHYQWDQYDDSWVSLDADEDCFDSDDQSLFTDTGLVVLTSKSDLRYYDAVAEKQRWAIALKHNLTNYALAGTDREQTVAYVLETDPNDYTTYLMKVELATGTCTSAALEHAMYRSNAVNLNGIVYYSDRTGIVRLDPETLQTEYVACPEGFSTYDFRVRGNGSRFLIWNSFGEYRLIGQGIDLQPTGGDEPERLKTGLSINASAWSENADRIAVTDGACIYVFDGEFCLRSRIDCNAMAVSSMCFYGDLLLVAYRGQGLYRYRADTGEYLGKTQTACGTGYQSIDRWDFSREGELALHLDNDLSIIDLQTWQVRTYVANCQGYCPQEQKVFVGGWASNGEDFLRMGLFKIYDYRELITKAKSMLNGLELSQDQKNAYGID